MANPQIQIGNLEFDDIKESIKTYLRSQDVFSDYDFEGSALSTLIDILSYNTLYYAFYSNMIANEMFFDTAQKVSSLISLSKPLGYTVPGSRSAKSPVLVRAGGVGKTIPRYHKFVGQDEAGGSYNFYTFQPYDTDENGEVLIDVYQGGRVFKNIAGTLNADRTKIFISDVTIDIRSLLVEVKTPSDDDFVEWVASTSINQDVTESSRVYFLERTDAGFFVVFGGNYVSDVDRQAGAQIPEGSEVRLSYVTSSGERGNAVGNFKSDFSSTEVNNNAIIETKALSSGGAVDPNIEAIKFFAPKFFAAQDRAVTKQDAVAVLGNTSLGENIENSDFKFVVWGGEENDPPYYGRVFVSIINSDENTDILEPDLTEVQSALDSLRRKLTITILPEYVGPVASTLRIGMSVTYDDSQTNMTGEQLRSMIYGYLNETYPTRKAFNKKFILSDLISGVASVDSSLNLDPSSVSTKLEMIKNPSNNARLISVKNPILKNSSFTVETTATQSTIIDTDTNQPYTNLELRNSVNPADYDEETGWGYLNAYKEVGGTLSLRQERVGRVNYDRGLVEINQGVLTGEFTLSVKPRKLSFNAKQEMINALEFNVTVTKETSN